MIALDTNILVRILVQDDEAQFKSAYAILNTQEVYIPDSVILETEWVLRYAFDLSPAKICSGFRSLFGLTNVVLEDPLKMAKVLKWHASGLDFADALHLAKSEHLPELKTFDSKFGKRAKGLSECKVSGP